jgi:hypothetical protein
MNFCPALRISWPVWVKFGVRYLHLPSLRNYEFGDNRYGGSCTLLKGANEVLPYFLRFSFDFFFWGGGGNLLQEVSTDIYRVSASFVKIGGI